MLFIAAINVSIGWALGVWLPFGPLCFRRTFPDLSRPSAPFRTATIVFCGLYLLVAGSSSEFYRRKSQTSLPLQSNQATGYGTERSADSGETKEDMNVEERRSANTKELDRLAKWADVLRLKKRDLLRSDVQGNRTYEAELGLYDEAFSKATLEKDAIAPAPLEKGALAPVAK
jgi:hypothetical protein